ncbi:hypothetical protein AMTR_s00079p00060500 [Amborella trichopoda]|uniref:Retrovirus-related Pol polyprotein from transposon TNT 1-94-like beta-barrel domain-containing protein n=1 Tax=Amborella trichopoda TaxID=13333 RepID=W1P8L7_AMBTC|nr:hypothetical protein AMTR_s00079p00060500 [Amborella trichopoda]
MSRDGTPTSNCKKKKVSNYCKETGDLITECRKRPQNKKKPTDAHAASMTNSDMTCVTLTPPSIMLALPSILSQSLSASLRPEFLQQVIQVLHVSSFGKGDFQTSWVLDSDASNHMTGNLTSFKQVVPYKGTQSVHIANGQSLPLDKVGSLLIHLVTSSFISF